MWTEEQQIQCMGMTEADAREMVREADEELGSLPSTVVSGIMSDVQEMISRGSIEQARQALNAAKFIQSEFVTKPARAADRLEVR